MLATWYYSEGEVAVGYAKVGIANREQTRLFWDFKLKSATTDF